MKIRLISLTLVGILLADSALHAQVPRLVNYQGRVAVGGVNFDGTGQFKFALVDAVGATTHWSNDGTSVAGSEPTQAVSLPVSKGLYAVLLGDTSLANMTALPASAFTHPDVRLRVWFNDGVNGAQLLTPDQRLAPASYLADSSVTNAAIVSGAIDGTRLAPASLNASHLSAPAAPAAGQVLSYDGAGFAWIPAAGGGGDSVFSLNGANAYYVAGNVGVGTTTPANKLTVRTTSGAYGMEHTDGTVRLSTFVGGSTGGGWLGTQSNHKLSFFTNDSTAHLTIDTAGNVGIGTASPTSRLEITGQDALKITGYQPFLTLRDTSANNARTSIQSVSGGLNLFTENYLNGSNPFGYVRLDGSGNLGVGSAQPTSKLEVVAQDAVKGVGYQPFFTLADSNAGYARSRIQGVGGEVFLESEAYINGTRPNGWARLDNNGDFSVGTLTIRGGADLAEPFEFTACDVPKGAVMIIDAKNPGKLTLSRQAYDKRVAGVVSGANGVNPGISLHQEGLLENGRNVALTGRVYVQADASGGAIEPGDLLTSSNTPGHAMKAVDHARAQGAILGKAMTPLESGRGMVLVLVTLQ